MMTASATPTPTPTPLSARSLLPREHGAWGQLAMPLLSGLLLGRPGAAPLLLAAAVVFAFVAHEPLLVLLGQRGRRVRDVEGPRAWRWLAALGGAAAVTGALGLALAPRGVARAALVPAALAAAVAVVVWRKLEKTTAGEILVAVALASAGWLVALAGGAPAQHALAVLLAWSLAFAAATLGVQVILERLKSRGTRDVSRRNAALVVAVGAAAVALAARGLPAALAWAVMPTVALSAVVCFTRVKPRDLRTLGWALVASSIVTLVLLVAGLRLGW